ncbi:MAG: type IX secretion system membrane protein PorP/SprF [Bacteroidota bacterium]
MKYLISTIIFAFTTLQLSAQNDVQYTHFLFNKLAFNAAYAGSAGQPTATALYRNQWISLEGAPTTATLNFHTPFFQGRSGFGMNITADRVGFLRSNSVEASYAYRFNIAKGKGKLSLGINGRIESGKMDWNEANPLDIGDGSIPTMEGARVNPNFGFGIYYEQSNFYLGVSLPQIMNTSIYRDFDVVSTNSDFRTYYVMSGYLAQLTDNIKLQPGAMISFNPETPFELDMNANLIFMDAFWVGANYRLGDSFSALVQYQFTPQFRVGTAFDFTMTELNSYSNGSIEVMLSYVFQQQKDEAVEQVHHLRYF